MKRIGERIRKRRENLNLQLTELARRVGISTSALSQIEKAKSSPSVITLKRIADNLNTTVGELIGENENLWANSIVRRDDLKFISNNVSGTELYLISDHDISKQMETYLLKLKVNSDLDDLFVNVYSQVFCYVLKGSIRFTLDNELCFMNTGDSIYFHSKVNFLVSNNDNDKTELLWIIYQANS